MIHVTLLSMLEKGTFIKKVTESQKVNLAEHRISELENSFLKLLANVAAGLLMVV